MTTWTKLKDGTWGIRGTAIVTGMPVTIAKRSGEKVRRVAGEIIWTNGKESLARVQDPGMTLQQVGEELEARGLEVCYGRRYLWVSNGMSACYTVDEANQFLAFLLAAQTRMSYGAEQYAFEAVPGRHFCDLPCTREQDALIDGGLIDLLAAC